MNHPSLLLHVTARGGMQATPASLRAAFSGGGGDSLSPFKTGSAAFPFLGQHHYITELGKKPILRIKDQSCINTVLESIPCQQALINRYFVQVCLN